MEAFRRHVKERYGEDVPALIVTPITEFATYDERSDVFRYDLNRDGKTHEPLQHAGESWIDLPELKTTMALLRRSFRRVLWADRAGEIPPAGVG